MLDSEAATLAHKALKDAQRHLSAAMDAFQGTARLLSHLKIPIQSKIFSASKTAADALSLVDELVTDQSAWGKYESHSLN